MADTSHEVMAKAYEPSKVEGPLYEMWLKGGYFRAQIDWDKEPFCIIMPPPNVTGELHLGHALTATIEDCLVRWHRMLGDPTLWLPGVDHAGIATQNVVEKQLAKEGLSRHDLGREQFLERVWQWVRKYRGVIAHQHARLGASCDWDREVFTMDEGPQLAVRTTFVKLYREGLIYRGERIINWCPRCQTALSDLEVEHEEVEGSLWYVRYPLLDDAGNMTDEYVVIATTRPETIVADVAVAVNPSVDRWRKIVGRKALLLIIERQIPIIADDAVDPEFGTGALKITPGHDPVDFDIGQRHDLSAIVAVAGDGTMNAEAGPYEGMDRFECRRIIVADLERLGLIEKVEPHRHSVGHCERCGTIVEPMLSKQWFVKMEPLARPAIEAVKEGRIRLRPRRFERVYFHWMENIRDWCISRQLWWGHRIPVWRCQSCGEEDAFVVDPTACAKCGSKELERDPDVLDTWFSSGLWPHSTLGWPKETEGLRYWYPTSVLETGYDILFFWVARMTMMGLYNMGEVPFRHVYLHGLIRDAQGRKMTKSLGNVVDPLQAIDKYGCDALRFTLATGGAPGNDFRLSDERLESARNFANKIWNAARFVVANLAEEQGTGNEERGGDPPLEDRWIVSRLDRVAGETNKLLSEFQINEAARLLYEFFWNEYCDWYVEMAKVRLKAGDKSPMPVLVRVLESSMRLLHPFMPFVTEAVWQELRRAVEGLEPEAVIAATYPKGGEGADTEAEELMKVATLDPVPAVRDVLGAAVPAPLRKKVQVSVFVDENVPEPIAQTIRERLLEAAPINAALTGTASPWNVPTQLDASSQDRAVFRTTGTVRLYIPLSDRVDLEAERSRLSARLREAEIELLRLEDKLANEQFRSKAPAQVVAREEEKLATARSRAEALRRRLEELG